MVRAIRFVLAQAGYKAGKYRIQFESFDNTTPTRHEWDERTCARNAHAHAADPAVVGVIGPFNSGCSAIEIPILNRVPVAMISPSNTYAGLTKSVVGTYPEEPATYYPAGGRNYTRIVASEDNEGRIGAIVHEADAAREARVRAQRPHRLRADERRRVRGARPGRSASPSSATTAGRSTARAMRS